MRIVLVTEAGGTKGQTTPSTFYLCDTMTMNMTKATPLEAWRGP